MPTAKLGFIGFLIILGLSIGSTVSAQEFDWIMKSISKLDSISNGDGHDWKFKSTGGGKWEVEAPTFDTAAVTSAGKNKISIDGFPMNWGADGIYVFTKKSGKCNLKSEESFSHELVWKC